MPLLGICRGFQEINVAFGGSLHPEIREVPGGMDHRTLRLKNGEIDPDLKVIYAERHEVRLTPGGIFAKMLGAEAIRVNSLHGQGILEPGRRIVVEGVAEDGTIEAIRIGEAPGFALGVQWHAEHVADPQSGQSHPVRSVRRSAGYVSADAVRFLSAARPSRMAPAPIDPSPDGRRQVEWRRGAPKAGHRSGAISRSAKGGKGEYIPKSDFDRFRRGTDVRLGRCVGAEPPTTSPAKRKSAAPVTARTARRSTP